MNKRIRVTPTAEEMKTFLLEIAPPFVGLAIVGAGVCLLCILS